MKQWIKQYLVYVLLALSLLVSVNFFSQNQRLQQRINELQNLVETSAVTLEVYDADATLLKTVTFLPNESGVSLYDLMLTLQDRALLSSTVATSGWITSIHNLEGIGVDNLYWVIFSPSNLACKGFSDPGYAFSDVCQVGSKDIAIGYQDTFIFRLLAWNMG